MIILKCRATALKSPENEVFKHPRIVFDLQYPAHRAALVGAVCEHHRVVDVPKAHVRDGFKPARDGLWLWEWWQNFLGHQQWPVCMLDLRRRQEINLGSERTLWKGLPKKTPTCIPSLNNKGQETSTRNKQKWMNDTSPVILFPLLFCLRVIFYLCNTLSTKVPNRRTESECGN